LTLEPATVAPAIGVCNQDGNVWAVNESRRNCLFCGRPPDYMIPLESAGDDQPGSVGADAAGQSSPASPTPYLVTCPECNAALDLLITPDSISLTPSHPGGSPPEPAGEPAPVSPAGPSNSEGEHTASLDQPPAAALDQAPDSETPAESQEAAPL